MSLTYSHAFSPLYIGLRAVSCEYVRVKMKFDSYVEDYDW
jgi:hypothetical protein